MITLLADVGGTYIRFSLTHDLENLDTPQKFKVSDFESLNDAVLYYLFQKRVEADDITHFYCAYSARNGWDFAMGAKDLVNAEFKIINDFAANSYGVLSAGHEDLILLNKIDTNHINNDKNMAVIGAGTGLGLSYIINTPHGHHVVETHGGHMLPAFGNDEHRNIFAELQKIKNNNLSPIYEDVLSGNGLFGMHQILSHGNEYIDANDLIARGRDDKFVQQSIRLFNEILGVFAHQTLIFGNAYSGLYLTGGIIDRLFAAGLFDFKAFYKFMVQENVAVVKNDIINTPIYYIRDEFISLRGLLLMAKTNNRA